MGKEYDRHFEDFRDKKLVEKGGILNISGKFLLEHEDEILNLVKHQGKLAQSENAEHKIKKLKKLDGKIIVETSTHNLALHIGKALTHAYKGKHEYKFLKGEKFVQVDWERD